MGEEPDLYLIHGGHPKPKTIEKMLKGGFLCELRIRDEDVCRVNERFFRCVALYKKSSIKGRNRKLHNVLGETVESYCKLQEVNVERVNKWKGLYIKANPNDVV